MNGLGAQRKALHQTVNLGNAHLPGCAEQGVVEQLGEESGLRRSKKLRLEASGGFESKCPETQPEACFPERELHYDQYFVR